MEEKKKESEKSVAGNKIDIDGLEKLVKLMGENDLVEVEYAEGSLSIRLSKRSSAVPVMAAMPASAAPAAVSSAAPAAPQADDKRFLQVTSPMVGTFYASGSPDAKPFATVGAAISEDSVVCLIEAMKVFNEIKAGVSGKIAKICVKNEDPVEFGQVLFLVDPS